jgi:CTD small phosphatase-like protein 2
LDAIEQDRLYFDYRLYRQHTIIFENDFVKDISRLGRDLSKIIIVDNMPQNFRLQKENGIFIKTFYGEDPDDTALMDLIPILKKVAQDKKDIRTSLMKCKDDILKRISSNIEKQSLLNKHHGK